MGTVTGELFELLLGEVDGEVEQADLLVVRAGGDEAFAWAYCYGVYLGVHYVLVDLFHLIAEFA